MKTSMHFRDAASRGAALMIVLALVVLLTGLALAYFTRATTDRQLAQASYNDTSADLLARTGLDTVVGSLKQEILNAGAVNRTNIQPQRSGGDASIPNLIRRSVRNDGIPVPGVPSLASAISSGPVDLANPRRGEITLPRWNKHYLIPRHDTGTTIDSPPISPLLGDPAGFIPPDWVLVTAQGPNTAPPPGAVIGRYAFAVYDEGGLLDMNLAGYPNWPDKAGCAAPSATPWLVNVGRKGTVAFADLTALGAYAPPQPQVDQIVGWRNYATTQQPGPFFPSGNPNFTADCTRPNFYGSYLLYFGDPPFIIDSDLDKLTASLYPFTSVANYASGGRTDQSLMTRQQLLKFRSSLGFSQNVLQYMGTFSRERNKPAPDWPGLNAGGYLSEGRFNLNNLDMVIPNPDECVITKGKKKGWQTGKNKNKTCGTPWYIVELFGLFWRKAELVDPSHNPPHASGHWIYVGKDHGPNPNGKDKLDCFTGPNRQNNFFQILHYALNQLACSSGNLPGSPSRTFAVGASLIDQWDSGAQCPASGNASAPQPEGCDLDWHGLDVQGANKKWAKRQYTTHTTVIEWGNGGGNFAYGMEPNYSGANGDPVNGDWTYNDSGCTDCPHRPCGNSGGLCATGELPAPAPVTGGANPTQVVNRGFTTVGEFGYGVDTSTVGLPTLKFWDSSGLQPFKDAPVLDFFSYNPVSSSYPRAGIVNLYTKNAPVIAAVLKSALKNDTLVSPPASVISQAEATNAANAIVAETQRVLSGSPTYGSVQQTDLTRAVAGRLTKAAIDAVPSLATTEETKGTVARALSELGQTRTWNLFIDVIAQTGKYKPNAPDLTGSNFVVESEKRYWLHIALGRDLVSGQVDVLGTQLEEVIE